MKLVLKAIHFAVKKHEGQLRKVSGDPYVVHPLKVSYLLAAYKRSKKMDEILAAAILHDTLEDTETNFVELATEFTPLVASLVLELSNDKAEIAKIGKLEYQKKKMLGISNYALLIKLADRMHNVSDSPTMNMVEDTINLMQYLFSNRKLTKTQEQMYTDILEICNNQSKLN